MGLICLLLLLNVAAKSQGKIEVRFAIKSLRPASLRTGLPENRHFLLLSPTNSTTYNRGATQHGSFWQTEIAS
jgi:hypothetical protein